MPSEPGTSDPNLPQPGRIWSVEEANRRLGSLKETLPALRAWVVRLRKVHDELHRLATFWGKDVDAADHPDRELKMRLDEEWRTLTKRLEGEVSRLNAEGIEIKDLESGLVDFYGYVGGEVVYLCWQRGEESIGFYHTLEGGYRSRRPLASAPSSTHPGAARPP